MGENANSFLVLFLAPVKEHLEADSVPERLVDGCFRSLQGQTSM